jgi:hypothetical protein
VVFVGGGGLGVPPPPPPPPPPWGVHALSPPLPMAHQV